MIGLSLKLSANRSPPTNASQVIIPPPPPIPTPTTAPSYLATAATAQFATYGAQRMVDGYAGPLFQLRRDDGATLDISTQTGGDYPDYAAIDAWAGGNIPTVSILYDQSGNANNMVQAVVANQPSFDTSQVVNGLVPILFDSFARTITTSNPEVDKFLSVGGLTGLDAATMSNFIALQPQTNYNRMGYWLGTSEDGATDLIETFQGISANRITERKAGKNKHANDLDVMGSFTPFAYGAAHNGNVVRQWTRKGTDLSGGANDVSATVPRLTLGKASFGGNTDFYGMFRFFGAVFYGAAVSDADGQAIFDSMQTAFALAPAPEYAVTFIGDSIIEGTGSRLLQNTPHLLSRGLTKPNRTYSFGVHGERLSSANSQSAGRYTDAFEAGIPNVAFIQGGINDIGSGGAGADVYANVTTPLITFLQGLGFEVVVCTLTPTDGHANWNAGLIAQRDAYNAAVVANAGGADAVLDLASHAIMGASSADPALYPDGLHPSSLGYAHLTGAPSGTYAGANTYYEALQTILQGTALGGSYTP